MQVNFANPEGVDVWIGKFQNSIEAKISTALNLQTNDYACYPRAYRNQTADGYVPEVYMGNNEYKEVLFDDNFKMTSFFGLGETVKLVGARYTAQVSLIFMVNLTNIYPYATDRQDENLRATIERICNIPAFGFVMNGYETGIDKVFKEYSGWRIKTGVKFRDQHPLHCFRINFELNYNNLKSC